MALKDDTFWPIKKEKKRQNDLALIVWCSVRVVQSGRRASLLVLWRCCDGLPDSKSETWRCVFRYDESLLGLIIRQLCVSSVFVVLFLCVECE